MFWAVLFLSAAAEVSPVVVVKPVSACAVSERQYAARLAEHAVRWLGSGGVKADLAADERLAEALAGRRLAVLVMPSKPDAAQIAALRAYRARGGRICAFYSSSDELAGLMGLRLGRYRKPAGDDAYGSMAFVQGSPVRGLPASIRQSSANAYTAFPASKRSRVIAWWRDKIDRRTADPAVLESDAGWWVTHVFSGDGDEKAKARFLLACAGACSPGSWDPAAWDARERAAAAELRAFALAQKPRAGEIRGVWDQSGEGYYPGDWPKTMRMLAAHGITDVYVNASGAGFAHYPSKCLPPSAVFEQRGDQLGAAVAAAKGTGIRVHAWFFCFNAERATPERLVFFSRRGWRLRDATGTDLKFLDASDPRLQAYLLAAIDEIVRNYAVDGVHLDFVRWHETPATTETTPGAMTRFRRESKDLSRAGLWAWRAEKITQFVKIARARVKAIRPGALVSTAVFGKYPSCVNSAGQAWQEWIAGGLVDYATPMNYTSSAAKYAELVNQQGASRARAGKTVSGIGVTAYESRLDARAVIAQINAARAAGLAGVAFFDLDHTFVTSILPYLRLGVFRAP